jgi:pimeloyl-ACP methyl ester carboxylesterase
VELAHAAQPNRDFPDGKSMNMSNSEQAREHTSALATGLGREFRSERATVNGITLHYVRGGNGPAVILIHGFPQDWSEYRAIMPRLAKRFTVIAVDLRGVGGSTATPGGYDAANMAEDVYQLASALKLERAYIVGHDLGGMVAFAFVRRHRDATRGAMILDVPLPGIEGWDEIQGDPVVWHIRFMQVPGLPEKLVTGRQAEFFGSFRSGHAFRVVRRPQSALPKTLHDGTRRDASVCGVLAPRRPRRGSSRASPKPRRELRCSGSRADRRDRDRPQSHGLEGLMGIVLSQRL